MPAMWRFVTGIERRGLHKGIKKEGTEAPSDLLNAGNIYSPGARAPGVSPISSVIASIFLLGTVDISIL